ncbi:N-acetylglucosaminyl-phosphatidylinositol de-N-acetylase [Leucoagaricus sp. SymC.cos]|nr:N-acetylglucosaminyl-phosphatidylinositol de-N-acetylase [Leucoagaricus sp. SymC.cos]
MLRPTITILLSILTLLLYHPFDTGNFTTSNGHSRILILTAHPDDECMFFAPTILGLNVAQENLEVSSLCLSVGDADGLGVVREKEYHESYAVLGVPAERRWIVDHPNLQDNFTATWDAGIISKAVSKYVIDNGIDTVLTFDYEGISSHPNHKSLPRGVTHLMKTLHTAGRPTPRLYTLVTVPVYTKYTSIIAPLLAKHDPKLNARGMPVFVSGIPEYLRALRAMRKHRSQLVWFRWLYVSFSRYMWVNEWLEIKVH